MTADPTLEADLLGLLDSEAVWDAIAAGEDEAKQKLMDLWDESAEGYACGCDVCVVRTILETVLPQVTNTMRTLISDRCRGRD